jgi:hypothetical protein
MLKFQKTVNFFSVSHSLLCLKWKDIKIKTDEFGAQIMKTNFIKVW